VGVIGLVIFPYNLGVKDGVTFVSCACSVLQEFFSVAETVFRERAEVTLPFPPSPYLRAGHDYFLPVLSFLLYQFAPFGIMEAPAR